MTQTFSEQKVLYNFEDEFCRRFRPVAVTLGCHYLHRDPRRQGNNPDLPHWWELGARKKKGKWPHAYKTRITFEGFDYVDGDPEYGTQQIFDLEDKGRGFFQKYDPSNGNAIDGEIEETIGLNEETWSTYMVNASFEITNRTTIKADAKASVGVAEANLSAENETIASSKTGFGLDDGNKTLRTYQHRILQRVKADANSRPFTLSVAVGKKKVITPVKETGYLDTSIMLDLYDWADEQQGFLRNSIDIGPNRITCDNIQDLLWFLEGQRVAEYPNMRGYLGRMKNGAKWHKEGKRVSYIDSSCQGALDFYNWLKDQNNRKVTLEKQKVKVYEAAGEVVTTWLGNDADWPEPPKPVAERIVDDEVQVEAEY